MLVGILILFSENLGVSAAGRVTIKTIHVWLGYVMTVNLVWRFVWASFGNRCARWRAMGGRSFQDLRRIFSKCGSFMARKWKPNYACRAV
jgi:Ni/Fe-hydrogenase 1 B-type cytochrome subunit